MARALADILEQHGREVDALEESARVALLRVYRGLADEVEARLRRVAGGATVTTVHAAVIADQMGGVLLQWAEDSGDALAAQTTEAIGAGLRQLAAEVLTAEAAVNAGSVAELLRTWRPVVPAEAVAYAAQTGNLIIARQRPEIAAAVSTSLAESIAVGEGTSAAARRMRNSLDAETWRLERIARTEINAAMNAGHQSALSQQARDFPSMGLLKQWSAHRDNRTSQTCLTLDGALVGPEEAFSTAGLSGPDGAALPPFTSRTPPAHPNCRSRIVPYSARWAGL